MPTTVTPRTVFASICYRHDPLYGHYPLYATSMMLHLVLIPYMPTDLILCMPSCLRIATVMDPYMVCSLIWFLHAISPLFCYCRGSIHSTPTNLILYTPFCLLSCYYHAIHSLATICVLFLSCSFCDKCFVLFTVNILLIWVLKVLVVCSDLKAWAKWSYQYESITSIFWSWHFVLT